MIRGLGIDLVHVLRIRDAAERRGERFLKRLFTDEELSYCARHPEPARHWAARFAAKEAAMKALGTGWNAGVSWRAIEVVNLPSGQPTLRLHGAALERARSLGATASHITITHDGEFAQACVVLEGPDGDGAHGTGAALAEAILAGGETDGAR